MRWIKRNLSQYYIVSSVFEMDLEKILIAITKHQDSM